MADYFQYYYRSGSMTLALRNKCPKLQGISLERCRSKPGNFSDYSFASTIMKYTITKEPVRIFEMCSLDAFTTRRNPDRLLFYNNARGRIGSQAI